MENSIIVVCLDYEFACKVAQIICSLTGKFYLDSEQLFKYEIPNKEAIIDNCGYEYFKKQEDKFIRNLADYENTIISLKYEMFSVDEHYLIFKNLPCYYLFIPKNDKNFNIVEKISYKDRHNLLVKYCKCTIDCSFENATQIANQIISRSNCEF